MEWVETTGRTVQEATEHALDQLGVDENDAEVVVLEESRAGFLGLGRADARIRARVRPAAPRQKRPPRARRPRNEGATRRPANAGGSSPSPGTEVATDAHPTNGPREKQSRTRSGRRNASEVRSSGGPKPSGISSEESSMTIEQQSASVQKFVAGVVERFGFDAETIVRVEDGEIFVDVNGEELGLLVGPRGATLDSLQELARTVIQRRTEEHAARVTVDVAGFRARRTAALETFVRRVAAEVVSSGVAEALEPMSAADRKIAHDTVNAIDGAVTTSEGVEPRRYVVIRPSVAEAEAEHATAE
ncbi:MAG TPA: RNA-binding cell elongation regulator Jag/EloR [Acidimicrobiales bacterium]